MGQKAHREYLRPILRVAVARVVHAEALEDHRPRERLDLQHHSAVLEDDDAAKLQELGYGAEDAGFSDADIDKLVAERQAARQRRDFASSDRIRKELADRGIILEDNRDGSVRWKRK